MSPETFDIAAFLDPATIQLDLTATDRVGAIRELSQVLADADYVSDTETFVDDVIRREELGATGLGSGIAIPHGKSPAVTRTTVAIGRTRQPIEWPSLDGEPVTVAILFAVRDADADTLHLKLLQRIAILLASDDFIQELSAAATAEEVIALIVTRSKEKEQ